MSRSSSILLASLLTLLSATTHIAASSLHARRPTSVAVLDFSGDGDTARRAADTLSRTLASALMGAEKTKLSVTDRDLARAAARGAGYENSLNLTLGEARDLGVAIGADFFIVGEAQTLRRSPSDAPVYFESYASLFVVSARTGRLVLWDRPTFNAPTPERAERLLLAELEARPLSRIAPRILEARDAESRERRASLDHEQDAESGDAQIIDLSLDEETMTTARKNLRDPQPFRRLRPPYPDAAARSEVEATVDVLVDIDADGEVARVEVARWAGYGLEESVVSTVRQLHFRPATLPGGEAVPVRVLLRYNFRRPPRKN